MNEPVLYIKKSDQYKSVTEAYIKRSDGYKKAKLVYVKDGGVWKHKCQWTIPTGVTEAATCISPKKIYYKCPCDINIGYYETSGSIDSNAHGSTSNSYTIKIGTTNYSEFDNTWGGYSYLDIPNCVANRLDTTASVKYTTYCNRCTDPVSGETDVTNNYKKDHIIEHWYYEDSTRLDYGNCLQCYQNNVGVQHDCSRYDYVWNYIAGTGAGASGQDCKQCSKCSTDIEYRAHVCEEFSDKWENYGSYAICVCTREIYFSENCDHTISDTWAWDESNHWKTCTKCNATFDEEMHDFDKSQIKYNTDGHWWPCKICGATVTDLGSEESPIPHNFNHELDFEHVCGECGILECAVYGHEHSPEDQGSGGEYIEGVCIHCGEHVTIYYD